MNERFEWEEKYITGNDLLDNQHKYLFDLTNELYEMFSDTKFYNDQIPEIAENLKDALINHCYIENDIFKKYNILNVEEHVQAHNVIIESINDIKNYNLSPLIYAMLICDSIVNYFLEHFPKYDIKFINELNKKILLEVPTE